MGRLSSLLYSMAIGAGLMYFLDPQSGNRRKAMVRDRMLRLQRQGDEALDTAVRDLRNRTRGILSETMAIVDHESQPDHVLEERVRARLGFLTRHPGAINVSVQNKRAILSGDVLADDAERLVMGIYRTRGLNGVQNELTVHQDAGNIPHLQGEGWLPGQDRGSVMWSPSTRLLATGGGAYLLLYGMIRGGFIGTLARFGGLALAVRALTNMDFRTLAGTGSDFEAVRIRKSINIDAPVDEVYDLWANFENFPRFMANVEEIQEVGEGRSHWVVKGPAGSKVEFDAIVTDNRPNELVAWETTPDSQVKHRGQVRFKEAEKGTQVNVTMAYTPPAGMAGHAVAKLFGKDPKSEMDSDLARMKSLLEEGKTTANSKTVKKDRVMPVTGGSKEQKKDTGSTAAHASMEDDENLTGSANLYGADPIDPLKPENM
jgi:uncharacterized membrane protein